MYLESYAKQRMHSAKITLIENVVFFKYVLLHIESLTVCMLEILLCVLCNLKQLSI